MTMVKLPDCSGLLPIQRIEQIDFGKGYRYAHDEASGFIAGVSWLPEGLASTGSGPPVER